MLFEKEIVPVVLKVISAFIVTESAKVITPAPESSVILTIVG